MGMNWENECLNELHKMKCLSGITRLVSLAIGTTEPENPVSAVTEPKGLSIGTTEPENPEY